MPENSRRCFRFPPLPSLPPTMLLLLPDGRNGMGTIMSACSEAYEDVEYEGEMGESLPSRSGRIISWSTLIALVSGVLS